MQSYIETLTRLWTYPMIAQQAWTEAWMRMLFSGFPEIDRDLPRAGGPGGERGQLPVPNPHQLEKDRALFA